jgi:rhodanese-related sulfurtransferase
VTLLGDDAAQVAQAQREMVRIGIDRPAAAATGGPAEWTDEPLSAYSRAMFADLAHVRHHRPVTVLDVRRRREWEDAHVTGSVNIPIHELLDRLSDVPAGEIWVHCAGGYRASVAASLLTANGVQVVLVDDSFAEHAAGSGLSLSRLGGDVAA